MAATAALIAALTAGLHTAPLPPDDPAHAAVDQEYCSIAFGSIGSNLWRVHTAVRTHPPNVQVVAADSAFNTPGVTVPIGVKKGESYLFNLLRSAFTDCSVGLPIVTPAGCTSVRFEIGARKWITDAATTETAVVALYESDGTTLVGTTQAISPSSTTLGALYTLTVPVTGNTEYVVRVWFNNPDLGTQGGGGDGTSARLFLSRCRVVPLGAGMTGVFAGPFWGFERLAWDLDSAEHASTAPGPSGWAAEPGPTALATIFGDQSDRYFNERIIFAPWALRRRGRHFAVLYGIFSYDVLSPDGNAWQTPIWRTAPLGMTEDRHMSAATLLPVPTSDRRTLAQITTGGTGALDLLILQGPQAGRVLRAYVGAYEGTRVEPPPAFPRVGWFDGNSILAGVTFRADHAPTELLRAQGGGVGFPGHIVAHAAGGSALLSYGYVGDGAGGLAGGNAATQRAAFRTLRTTINLTITETFGELGTNDWAGVGAGISRADFAIGVAAYVADSRADFPTAPVFLQQVLGRTNQGLANLGGATLIPDFKSVPVDEAAAHPTYVKTRDLEADSVIPKGDGTHLIDASTSNGLYVARIGAWIYGGWAAAA